MFRQLVCLAGTYVFSLYHFLSIVFTALEKKKKTFHHIFFFGASKTDRALFFVCTNKYEKEKLFPVFK